MFDGTVFGDDSFHCVVTAAGEWPVGVQLSPHHVPPDWPDGAPQQVHVDLHVEDPRAAHEQAIGLGARLLQAGDFDAEEGHRVYADPAGHPFCIGWGHPSREGVAALFAERLGAQKADGGSGVGESRPTRAAAPGELPRARDWFGESYAG
jgi:hypothetical protein